MTTHPIASGRALFALPGNSFTALACSGRRFTLEDLIVDKTTAENILRRMTEQFAAEHGWKYERTGWTRTSLDENNEIRVESIDPPLIFPPNEKKETK